MRRFAGVAVALSLLFLAGTAEARDWPEIPRSEWQLEKVGIAPQAPAVVLLESGTLEFDERNVSSFFEVYRRIKILNEDGREHGTVSVPSTNFHRMRDLEGRTHLPDGRVVPLDEDAKFEKKYSAFYKFSIHSFAMPAVEVGSIVEYSYRLYFDSPIFTEPWFFQGDLPKLRSEITCQYPKNFGFSPVRFSPYGLEIKEEQSRTPTGQRVTYWMENAPPVPDEPWRIPFQDLSAWALFIPQEVVTNNQVVDLLKSWEKAAEIMEGFGRVGYRAARKNSKAAKAKAKELAGNARGLRERAVPIYEFVRDQIRTESWSGVAVDERPADKTLKEARGTYADKAVLLQAMLKAVKVDSTLGWVRSRDQGRAHQNLPTPGQFDQILVVLELDGERVFLDPSDPQLPFGHLPPELEGVDCLLVDERAPEWVVTPVRPAAVNSRLARLRLEVGEDGLLSGNGNLWLKGLHAWSAAHAAQTRDEPLDYWTDWLENRLGGFEIEDVEIVEDLENPGINVRWRLAQNAVDALGDEVSLRPSRPLGLTTNPFSLPPGRRLTPVQLRFADVDTVEVHLKWPEGWELDAAPELKTLANGAGRLETSFEIVEEERRLTASRTFEVSQAQFIGTAPYAELHELYSTAATSDAEAVILVRE